MADQHPEFVKGYLLGVSQSDSLQGTVVRLANLVNEHSMILFALCKHLKTTPQAMIESLTPEDFLNPEDSNVITS